MITGVYGWLNTDSSTPLLVQAGFDGFGNKIFEQDAVGSRTEWSYDPTHRIYVTETRQPKYFAPAGDTRFRATATWNLRCSSPSTVTDINLLTTHVAYDVDLH